MQPPISRQKSPLATNVDDDGTRKYPPASAGKGKVSASAVDGTPLNSSAHKRLKLPSQDFGDLNWIPRHKRPKYHGTHTYP